MRTARSPDLPREGGKHKDGLEGGHCAGRKQQDEPAGDPSALASTNGVWVQCPCRLVLLGAERNQFVPRHFASGSLEAVRTMDIHVTGSDSTLASVPSFGETAAGNRSASLVDIAAAHREGDKAAAGCRRGLWASVVLASVQDRPISSAHQPATPAHTRRLCKAVRVQVSVPRRAGSASRLRRSDGTRVAPRRGCSDGGRRDGPGCVQRAGLVARRMSRKTV